MTVNVGCKTAEILRCIFSELMPGTEMSGETRSACSASRAAALHQSSMAMLTSALACKTPTILRSDSECHLGSSARFFLQAYLSYNIWYQRSIRKLELILNMGLFERVNSSCVDCCCAVPKKVCKAGNAN